MRARWQKPPSYRARGRLRSYYVKIPIMLLRIDHVGIACRSLEAAIERYVSVFGLAVVSQETNAEQGVREAMLAFPSGLALPSGLAASSGSSGSSYVQLLEPLGDDSPVGKFLVRRGEGMHHIGYAVADVTAALAEVGGTGVRLIDSRPRHGSMGASIAFLHPGDLGGVLTELVQPAP
jgi:methylmalonyl-CoA/ethylmalonyl-CoA epimerase